MWLGCRVTSAPVNVTQRTQPGRANAGFPGYPAPPSTPLRLHLLRVGDTSCTRRVHGACGRGWLGSRSEPALNPGRSRSPGSSPAPPLPRGAFLAPF